MEEITCPEERCPATLDIKGQVFMQLPIAAQSRYKRLILWKQTMNNPFMRLCPTPDCDGIIDTSKGKMSCSTCGVTFCKECQLPQHKGPCDKNFEKTFATWKRCPKCRMFVEKNGGCDHITCICGYHFCYWCLKKWEFYH